MEIQVTISSNYYFRPVFLANIKQKLMIPSLARTWKMQTFPGRNGYTTYVNDYLSWLITYPIVLQFHFKMPCLGNTLACVYRKKCTKMTIVAYFIKFLMSCLRRGTSATDYSYNNHLTPGFHLIENSNQVKWTIWFCMCQ